MQLQLKGGKLNYKKWSHKKTNQAPKNIANLKMYMTPSLDATHIKHCEAAFRLQRSCREFLEQHSTYQLSIQLIADRYQGWHPATEVLLQTTTTNTSDVRDLHSS